MEEHPQRDEAEAPGEEAGAHSAEAEAETPPSPSRTGRLFDRLTAGVTSLIQETSPWAPLTLLICAAPGLLVAPLLDREQLPHILDNRFDLATRDLLFLVVLGSILLVSVVYASRALPAWRRQGWSVARERIADLNNRLLGLLVLPCVPVLMTPRVETTAPYLTVLVALGAAVVTCVAVMRFPWQGRSRRLALSRWVPLVMVLLLTAGYAALASVYSLNHHHNLGTGGDLAIYDNIFWQTIHGYPLDCTIMRGGNHVWAHVDPILIPLSALYLIYPRAETLLVLQSIWLALTALPLFLLARNKLESPWLALLLAAAALLQPALHGSNFFNFHSLALAAPVLVWCLYCLETGRTRLYWLFFVLLLTVREDMALLGCFIGLHAILNRRAPGLGLISIALGVIYFAAIKLFVMPDPGIFMTGGTGAYSYAGYFDDLIPEAGDGLTGLVTSVLTNPFFALHHAASPRKLMLLAKLLVPLLFLPLFARRGKVLLLYGFAFIFLASRPAMERIHFQYPTVLYPLLLVVAVLTLSDLKRSRFIERLRLNPRKLVLALTVGLFVASLGMTAKFGGLLPNTAFRAGWSRPQRTMNAEARARYRWVDATLSKIPRDASVSAVRDLAPHITARRKAYQFPGGWGSDYIFYSNDRRLGRNLRPLIERLQKSKAYRVHAKRGVLVLLKRQPDVKLPRRRPRRRRNKR